MYVDSHCHLSFPELRDRVDDIRREMAAARVDRALCICTTIEEFPSVHALATAQSNLLAMRCLPWEHDPSCERRPSTTPMCISTNSHA